MEAAKLYAEFVGTTLFLTDELVFSIDGFPLAYTMAGNPISQTQPTPQQMAFSDIHRERSGNFSEDLCICGMHSEEKLIASF